MVSHPETGSDPPIGSDRESGCDKGSDHNPRSKVASPSKTSYAIPNERPHVSKTSFLRISGLEAGRNELHILSFFIVVGI